MLAHKIWKTPTKRVSVDEGRSYSIVDPHTIYLGNHYGDYTTDRPCG
jgi:hypothetical protein